MFADHPFSTATFQFELIDVPGNNVLLLLGGDFLGDSAGRSTPVLSFVLEKSRLIIREGDRIIADDREPERGIVEIELFADGKRIRVQVSSPGRKSERITEQSGSFYLALPASTSDCAGCGVPALNVYLDSDEALKWYRTHPEFANLRIVMQDDESADWRSEQVQAVERQVILDTLELLDARGIPENRREVGALLAMAWPDLGLGPGDVERALDEFLGCSIEEADFDGTPPGDYLFVLHHRGNARAYDARPVVRHGQGVTLQVLPGTERGLGNLMGAIGQSDLGETERHALSAEAEAVFRPGQSLARDPEHGIDQLRMLQGIGFGQQTMAEIAPVLKFYCWSPDSLRFDPCEGEREPLDARVLSLARQLAGSQSDWLRWMGEAMIEEKSEARQHH